MSEPLSVLPSLDDVLAAARRLPVCDDAAKLHALIARILQAAESGGDFPQAVDALATAASAALDNDPWVQFGKAVGRLQDLQATLRAAPDRTSGTAVVDAPLPT
jgi:hypothetical protein